MGICNIGAQCIYAHVKDQNFKRKGSTHHAQGRCKRGDKCKYSHLEKDIRELNLISPSITNDNSLEAYSATTSEVNFREWRYQIPGPDRVATARPLGIATPRFWQDALKLVSGDAGIVQETITLLASNGGCARILELVGQILHLGSDLRFPRIFNMQILPFFKTITHTNVTTSVILVSRLMTIYNILYGPDGERAVSLFAVVVQYLQTLTFNNGRAFSSLEALEMSLAAFGKLVEVNTLAQVHDGLKLIAESLELIFEDNAEATASVAFQPARRHLRRLQQRFCLGHAFGAMQGIEWFNNLHADE
ncbi:hypothetical protein LTR56_026787 [Elasticomyces elasticus]|nr:hypothetical protein LTR56_026787 [Elasticomyces elasticus]KAK3618625.1 hypothetical protein LTR22_026309 [Elasticomyces elasticus]KAK4903595.1 hypothetical protein LTR49_026791 [Elasticomyces elasticus]KAK5737409.1 hypothetical protein LTS12_025895 [Elasticomyces elasticus]